MTLYDYIISVFILVPLTTLVHELGHVFFVKVFKGKVDKVILGEGKTIFSIYNLEFRLYYFISGKCYYRNLKYDNKFSKSIIHSGGVLFNIILSIICFLMINIENILYYRYYYNLFVINLIFIFINMMPFSFLGYNSDGMQIIQVIKTGNSKFSNKKNN